MAKNRAYYEQFLTNTNAVAYLNAISSVEAPTYYTNFGGQTIVPTSPNHPDVLVCAGQCSSAFGRYQFMPATWQRINNAIGPLDIRKPRDQDIAALWLLDEVRGTLNDVVAGNCIATLDNNSYEWASLPDSSSNFRYGGQGSKYDAQGFCKLVDSLKGTTLPEGPLVNNNAPSLLPNSSTSTPTSPFAGGGANFSDINCPPIKEDDLYRANFQITNPGCKISSPVQPITGSSTNGGTVNNSNVTNNSVGFSVNTQGFGQCSSLRAPCDLSQVTFTSPFGWRWGKNHNGVDLAAPIGTPIYAASNGIVQYAAGGTNGGFGNFIEIMSPEGIQTDYAHLDVIKCVQGQQVKVGQQIADMGNTGFSKGPHLHFQVKIDGNIVDPETCIKFR